MIEIEQAWKKIRETTRPTGTVEVPIDQSVGRVLGEAIRADQDSPRFDKSLVDGFALGSLPTDPNSFEVLEIVTAGQTPTLELSKGKASQVMTGAPVPKNTMAVVMIEQTEQNQAEKGNHKVTVHSPNVLPQQNILKQGTVIAGGKVLLDAGHSLQPKDMGVLTEFGISDLTMFRQPSVGILATGNELVPYDQEPACGQIRNSNGPLLTSLTNHAGGVANELAIGRDDEKELRRLISSGLENDILLIAGGVSAGVLDLIPQCLQACGVEQVFHGINLKPGKPLWYGTSAKGQPVFGLPGNPISSLVCFKLFVEPTIAALSGSIANSSGQFPVNPRTAKLHCSYSHRGGRRTFWPCQLVWENKNPELLPLKWQGSADQVTFLQADALAEFNGPKRVISKDEPITYVPL